MHNSNGYLLFLASRSPSLREHVGVCSTMSRLANGILHESKHLDILENTFRYRHPEFQVMMRSLDFPTNQWEIGQTSSHGWPCSRFLEKVWAVATDFAAAEGEGPERSGAGDMTKHAWDVAVTEARGCSGSVTCCVSQSKSVFAGKLSPVQRKWCLNVSTRAKVYNMIRKSFYCTCWGDTE